MQSKKNIYILVIIFKKLTYRNNFVLNSMSIARIFTFAESFF